MHKENRRIKIVLEGFGFKYSLFEVRDEDMKSLLGYDRGMFLRNRFRKYLIDDQRRVEQGEESCMIQFCTLVDDPACKAIATVADGDEQKSYYLDNIQGWKFIVPNAVNDGYQAHMPSHMPQMLMKRIEDLIDEYLDAADDKSIEALNGEYVTFFNLYTPGGKMMLCMRSRDKVRSEFVIELPTDKKLDIDKLSVMCREAQEVVWHVGEHHNEYDANHLIYDSRWHKGDVQSGRHQNIDYFITSPDPMGIDIRWFESWTA